LAARGPGSGSTGALPPLQGDGSSPLSSPGKMAVGSASPARVTKSFAALSTSGGPPSPTKQPMVGLDKTQGDKLNDQKVMRYSRNKATVSGAGGGMFW